MRFGLTRKRITIGVVALGLVTLFAWMGRDQPETVEMARASYAPLEVTVDEDGRTRVVDRYIVTSPVAGRLERIALREGARVEAGQVVARVEPMPLDEPMRARLEAQLGAALARQRAADAALSRATAAHEQAKRELERREALAAQGALALEQVEQYALTARSLGEDAEAARETASAAAQDVAAVRAALLAGGEESANRAAVTVRAPADGNVLRVPERSSRIVDPGEPLLEIGGTSVIEAVVDVLSADAVRIRPGMPVRFEAWGGPPLSGRVSRVEPAAFTKLSALGVEEQRVNVVLDIDDCPPELGDGFRIEANIVVWYAERALTVPSSALFRSGDGWRTFVHVDGRARLRDVDVGERSDASAQVLGGLEEGDEVILFPSDRLVDGAPVERGTTAGGEAADPTTAASR